MKLNIWSAVAGLSLFGASALHADKPAPAPLPNCNAAAAFVAKPMSFLACFGATEGNPGASEAEGLVASEFNSFIGSATVSSLGKSDESGNGPFTSNPTDPYGTLTFDTKQFGYFALILKGSDTFSGYLFNGGAAGVLSVDFNMAGVAVNKNQQLQDLSNARLLSIKTAEGGCVGCTSVPEPSSLAMMFAGLLGLGVAARRRNA